MKINKPKMIIFDYGHTLLYEMGFNGLRGAEALFKYIKSNKNNLTPEQVNDFSQWLFEKIGPVREMGLEMHERQFQRFMYEYLEIELSIPLPEVEKILWDNASPGGVMPNADVMIDYINSNGIRSGVISNIGWSGSALTERINRLLPRNKFEFVIASSDYMFRKPNSMLFEFALKKSGLRAEDVWFCGDNIKADVEGSASVGMFPVWYDNRTVENTWLEQKSGMSPNCEHLHIHDWLELIDVLEELS